LTQRPDLIFQLRRKQASSVRREARSLLATFCLAVVRFGDFSPLVLFRCECFSRRPRGLGQRAGHKKATFGEAKRDSEGFERIQHRRAGILLSRGNAGRQRKAQMPYVREQDVDPPGRSLAAPSPRGRAGGAGLLLRAVRVHPLASSGQGRAVVGRGSTWLSPHRGREKLTAAGSPELAQKMRGPLEGWVRAADLKDLPSARSSSRGSWAPRRRCSTKTYGHLLPDALDRGRAAIDGFTQSHDQREVSSGHFGAELPSAAAPLPAALRLE
jgi:hypothetical protein